ncbi:MAG TPA: hypothetical protein DIW48_09840 [Sphaerochaeta sp.]|nr:MAG: hypothetical protein A2Y31_01830 [Spirochaetes bacterium GWC2_52_13]HCS36964.1 hypothetical protein [Sphaerochaeta sp.]
MKRIIFLVVALCALGFLLVGCADRYTNPESRELVVFNDTTDQEIIAISIQTALLTGTRGGGGPNALSDGETIQPGARMSFYLPPFPDFTNIYIESITTEASESNSAYAELNRDNYILDDGVSVEARYYYDGTDEYGDVYLIELGGDGYAPTVDL